MTGWQPVGLAAFGGEIDGMRERAGWVRQWAWAGVKHDTRRVTGFMALFAFGGLGFLRGPALLSRLVHQEVHHFQHLRPFDLR